MYWYLATPYSKFPGGIDAANRLACNAAAAFIKAGVRIHSPIAHTHAIAMLSGMDPLDHAIWLTADAPMMEAAHGLIVLLAPSWEISYGIAEEIKAFEAMGKPIKRWNPAWLNDAVAMTSLRICRVTIQTAQYEACAHFGVTIREMLSASRPKYLAWPRQVAMVMSREFTTNSLPKIGRAFGRDHSTVLHAIKRVREACEAHVDTARDVEALRARLRRIVAAVAPFAEPERRAA